MTMTAEPTPQTAETQEMVPAEVALAREMFRREESNPILTAAQMPIDCKAVCNPGAAIVDGETLLLLRVIDRQDRSHLFVARSADGVTNWRVEPKPLLSPDTDAAWYDDEGCEDARLTYLEERGEWAIVYVGKSRLGAGVCLAVTRDFQTATRLGLTMHPYNKDAALFPRRINGRWQMLHRPTAGPLENVWISESDDLIHWGNARCVLEERDQPDWDGGKVGTGPPPMEFEDGWGLLFHGVQQVENGWVYRVGLVILDHDDPARVINRTPFWVFGPKEPYEFDGAKPGIVFPTGVVLRDEKLFVYYGAADTCVALATADVDALRALRSGV